MNKITNNNKPTKEDSQQKKTFTKNNGKGNVKDSTYKNDNSNLKGNVKTNKDEMESSGNNANKNNDSQNGKSKTNGKSNTKTNKPKGKGKTRHNNNNATKSNSSKGQGTDNQSTHSEVVENSRTGTTASSSSYDNPTTDTNGIINNSLTQNEPSVGVVAFKKDAEIGDGLSDANAYNNIVISGKALSAEAVDLQEASSIKNRMKVINYIVKNKKIFSPLTSVINYTYEEFEKYADTKKKYIVSLLNSTESDYNYAPQAELITVGVSFNFTANNPEIWSPHRSDVRLESHTFKSSVAKLRKLRLLEAKVSNDSMKIKNSNNPDKEFEEFKTRSEGKASFFNGFIPKDINDPKGDLNYKPVEFDMTINDAGNDKVPDSFKNDVSTINTYKSWQVFISNVLNITMNDPEYAEFRGLARNFPELIHFVSRLVNLRTFFEIVFYSIETVQGRALKIASKIGIVDGTFKQFFGSRITPALQDVISTLAGYLSEIPYNKRVVEAYKKLTTWGTLNGSDYSHEMNAIINVITILAGDLREESKPDVDKVFNFKEHAAASTISISDIDLLLFMLSHLKNFYKFEMGYQNSQSFNDDSNKKAYADVTDDDNSQVEFKDLFVVSPTRLTDSVSNLFRSFVRNSYLMEAFEKVFRNNAQFHRLFKAKGIFDGTDFAIDNMKVPVLGEITDEAISQFHSISWFHGMHLGTNYSQFQLIDADELGATNFMPSWRLFIENGENSVNYSNLIGFFTVGSPWLESEKPKSDYYKVGNYYNREITLKTNLNSVNLLDCMIIPFVPFNTSIKCGWNYGTIMKGETYVFDPQYGIIDTAKTLGKEEKEEGDIKKDYIQFFPIMFEWSSMPRESTRILNTRPTTAVYANHNAIGYYVTQSLVPFLLFSKNRSGKEFTLFHFNKWNFLPNYMWKHKGEEFHGLGFKPVPVWSVTVAQLFRNKVFGGLHPLARGRSYLDMPSLDKCILGDDA